MPRRTANAYSAYMRRMLPPLKLIRATEIEDCPARSVRAHRLERGGENGFLLQGYLHNRAWTETVTLISLDSSAPTRFPTFATRTGEPRNQGVRSQGLTPFTFRSCPCPKSQPNALPFSRVRTQISPLTALSVSSQKVRPRSE